MRTLKVWGGALMVSQLRGQARVIVAARTKKRAVELLDGRLGGSHRAWFNSYTSETGNPTELMVVTGEGVWYAPLNGPRGVSDYAMLPLATAGPASDPKV